MPKENFKKQIKLISSIKEDLHIDIPSLIKGKKEASEKLYLGKGVKVEPGVFFDTKLGAVVIGENVTIKANSVLRGPLYIGENSIVSSFSEISFSRIGKTCKIGGEVTNSFFDDYSNKQHHGFVGHSHIGKWVNLGAGTNVSNLKNTYSNIKVKGEDTGEMFMGVIIGDYVKSAINTSIFCGKVIGPSAHLYGTVTEDIPAFTSHVKPGVLYELPIEIAKKIQRVMAKRRQVEFTDEDEKNFDELFEQTKTERKKAKVKKGKLSFSA